MTTTTSTIPDAMDDYIRRHGRPADTFDGWVRQRILQQAFRDKHEIWERPNAIGKTELLEFADLHHGRAYNTPRYQELRNKIGLSRRAFDRWLNHASAVAFLKPGCRRFVECCDAIWLEPSAMLRYERDCIEALRRAA